MAKKATKKADAPAVQEAQENAKEAQKGKTPEQIAEENNEAPPVVDAIPPVSDEETLDVNKILSAKKNEDAIVVINTAVLPQGDIVPGERFIVGFSKEIPNNTTIVSEDGKSEFLVTYQQGPVDSIYGHLIKAVKLESGNVDKEVFTHGKIFSIKEAEEKK